MRMLSRSSLLAGLGALLLAGSASALTIVYDLTPTDARMEMLNQACGSGACEVPLTGTITVEDDEAGNVSITAMSLSHAPYEVATGNPVVLSIVLERTSITLGAGPIVGTGSTLTSVDFGGTTLAQVGTVTCTSSLVLCIPLAGLPQGTSPLPSLVPILDMGTWVFDATRALIDGIAPYSVTAQSAESMVVPEPATIGFLAAGLVGLAIRRRAGF